MTAIASGSTLGTAVVIGQLFVAGDGGAVKTAVCTTTRTFFVVLGQMSIQSVLNSYGAGVVAGYTTVFKVNAMMVTAFNTTSDAVSAAIKMMLCIAGEIISPVLIWRKSIIGLFIAQGLQAVSL